MPIDPEVKKQLDTVIGESYAPPRRWGRTIFKWLAIAALAIATSAMIVGILDTHVMKAQKDAAKKRPVPVFVVPAR
jgi:hypothetical protein